MQLFFKSRPLTTHTHVLVHLVLLVLFIFCQVENLRKLVHEVGNLCKRSHKDVVKASEESGKLMDQADGQKTEDQNGNGSVVNQSTDISCQRKNLVSLLVLKQLKKKCLISLLVRDSSNGSD